MSGKSVEELERDLRYRPWEFLYLQNLAKAPERPQEGMIVKADGVNWDPGAGAGVYVYQGTSWVKL